MKLIGIYAIRCLPTGKQYIGQSTNIKDRISVHLSKGCNCRYLTRAIKKYERHNFVSEILELCSESILDDRESHWISTLDTVAPNGLNLAYGGEGGGRRSKETKRLMSEKKSGKNHPLYGKRGKECHMYGKTRSKETRQKIANTLKGRYTGKDNPFARQDMHTDETIEYICQAYAKGTSIRKITKILKTNRQYIRKVLRKHLKDTSNS